MPMALSLLSSEKEENRLCGVTESIEKRTSGFKRLCESMRKATEVMFELLSQAIGVTAKVVFVRNRNKSRAWLALLSTDTSLSDKEVVRIYWKRWDIETVFKMAKSCLRLAKKFQGRSYDLMVVHTTIVFTRYIMLVAVLSRDDKDVRTLGTLFNDCCDE